MRLDLEKQTIFTGAEVGIKMLGRTISFSPSGRWDEDADGQLP
jgi:hypothetical protein